ncbi:helix-turn-helix transcriptional regulator [Ekhidna sp.]|uniref:helix-turn-helix transcriptional regulator n=1 Tax=Ekhidna sp. TaxID=2608089 RepID=UPI0032EEA544
MSIPLTPREKQVLQLILDEKSGSVIAQELNISERTVETHRKSIYSKTGVKTVVGLVKHFYNTNIKIKTS